MKTEVHPHQEHQANEHQTYGTDKNVILYGVPGTGKTYSSVIYAVAILMNRSVEDFKKAKYSEIYRNFKYYSQNGQIISTAFHQSYGYEEFVEGIRPIITAGEPDRDVSYKHHDGIFKAFCNKAKDNPNENYVFIIDEINRGNISNIFGELVTLIEPSRRIGGIEALEVKLPYSGEYFGVPGNVYIIGTMSTTDRLLAISDTVLRRRFKFVEILPNPELLKDIYVEDPSYNIGAMLKIMNTRITALLDREHVIGHSYFLPLKDNPTINTLADIFRHDIIPLLQEYFYDDYEMIRIVLGDNQKQEVDSKHCFIKKKVVRSSDLGNSDVDHANFIYSINEKAFKSLAAYDHLISAVRTSSQHMRQ